ncbi:MAG TPA: hypothetical protein VML50_16805 [Anaeromyxobacter sp.]|nr:hypothetical protein [Anaeromyxobacter sp.]
MTVRTGDPVPRTEAELGRLYHELARLGARAEGPRAPWRFGRPSPEEVVVLAAQASRRDPRLLWVLVDLLARAYDRFDPLKLRRALARARWPATLGVAFEFARRAAHSGELDDVARFVAARVPPAAGERYFLGTRAFGGALARRDVEESLAEYRRWGYFSREEPIAKELGASAHGSLDPRERLNLLRRLAERQVDLTLKDYLAALRGRASRRQATRDLARAPFLVRTGATRGARYRLAPAGRTARLERRDDER